MNEPLTLTSTPSRDDARGSETILLVEDDDAVRRLTARILRRLGYEVIEAEGVAEALSRFVGHERKLDLVVTDVVMPDGNGRALADRILK